MLCVFWMRVGVSNALYRRHRPKDIDLQLMGFHAKILAASHINSGLQPRLARSIIWKDRVSISGLKLIGVPILAGQQWLPSWRIWAG